MGDDHHCHPLIRQSLYDGQDFPDHRRIKRRGGLVEEHDLRLHRDRPRDRGALLLASRELIRIVPGFIFQPDALKELHSLLFGLRFIHLKKLHRACRDIFENSQVVEEVE